MVLTERDNLIIDTLKQQDFCLYKDIEQKFFSSKYAAYKRLKDLKKNRYIVIESLSDLQFEKGLDSSAFHFIGTNRKYICLKDKHEILRRKVSNWKINHQLLLFSLKERLESFLETEAIFENQIKDSKSTLYDRTFEPIPDFYFKGKNFKLAVELELSLKSQKRYWLKMAEYRKSSYSHILYIVTHAKTINKLIKRFQYKKYVGIAHYTREKEVISYRYGQISLSEWLRKKTK